MQELRQIVRDAAGGNAAAIAALSGTAMATVSNSQAEDSKASAEIQEKVNKLLTTINDIGATTIDRISEVSQSVSQLSENVVNQQLDSLKTMSLLERSLKHEVVPTAEIGMNKKGLIELQKSIETHLMRWEEKIDEIMKAHFEHSNRSTNLSMLERKVTDVLTYEKESKKDIVQAYETLTRSTSIGKFILISGRHTGVGKFLN